MVNFVLPGHHVGLVKFYRIFMGWCYSFEPVLVLGLATINPMAHLQGDMKIMKKTKSALDLNFNYRE
jgi:hypothetical protein